MKKILALILSLTMVFALVACTGTTQTETDKQENPFVAIDTSDGFFASGGGWDGSLPLVPEGEEKTITIGLRTSALCLDYNVGNAYTDWLEEVTGLNLEIITFAGSSTDVSTQISLMITGEEELPDILLEVALGTAMGRAYGREGFFVDLTDYLRDDAYYFRQALETYFPEEADFNRVVTEAIARVGDPVTGRIYQYPWLFHNENDNLQAQMWINEEWLAAVNMEAPTNIEELYDVLVAFRDQDPNGNGLKDEIPLIGRDNSRTQDVIGWLVNAFIHYMPTYKFNIEDGTVYTFYDQDEYRQALQFINKLVSEGLLSEMVWTTNNNEMTRLVNPAEGEDYTVGIFAGVAETIFTPDHESVFKYKALAPLADATGRGGYAPKYNESITQNSFITYSCDDPELAFRLMDFMQSSESYLRQRWGEKGVDWDYVDPAENRRGMMGGVARIEVYGNDVCFGYANNQCWHLQFSSCSETYWQYLLEDEDSWKARMYQGMVDNINYSDAAGQPEEVYYSLNRTEAEDEAWQEYDLPIQNYISAARAEFCTGRRDPGSDADWQKYLSDLNDLHYQENWVKVGQSHYNRQNGMPGLF